MKSPIIIDDHGDITFFDSVKEAEQYLEAIDVQNGEYVAYDSAGCLLHLRTDRNRVIIENIEVEPTHSSELRTKLQTFFTGPKIDVSSDWLIKATLEDLVKKALELKLGQIQYPPRWVPPLVLAVIFLLFVIAGRMIISHFLR